MLHSEDSRVLELLVDLADVAAGESVDACFAVATFGEVALHSADELLEVQLDAVAAELQEPDSVELLVEVAWGSFAGLEVVEVADAVSLCLF